VVKNLGKSPQQPTVSVIVCAHNEEEYVDRCLPSLLRALKDFSFEIIFVADRCSDKTVELAKKYDVKILKKTCQNWENSYSESLQLGYSTAQGKLLSIVDVDIIVPQNLLRDLSMKLGGKVASAAAGIATYPDTFWNRVMNTWEKTYRLAPLGREPYGAVRVVVKKVLDLIGGFRDVPTPDTDLDLRFAARGYNSVAVASVTVYHIRHTSLKSMVDGQIINGRGRYALGLSFMRTIGHSAFRFRPFLIAGWLFEWQRNLRRDKRAI